MRRILLILVVLAHIFMSQATGQNIDSIKKRTQDNHDLQATVEKFLFVAGNYDLKKMKAMIDDKANVGIVRYENGEWKNSIIAIQEYFEWARQTQLTPYYETVLDWNIQKNEDQLAFVYADAILHRYGVPIRHNQDYFTLIKVDGVWKFLNLSYTTQPLPQDKQKFDFEIFGKSYAQAWSGVRPEFVSSFFAKDGSLSINKGAPAVGRDAITRVAESFMTAFPDMVVSMDSIPTTAKGTEFHWTLTGTNTGPGGTGKKVKISGVEIWQMDNDGLVKKSDGSFDEAEYNRQLKQGVQ